ncbi:hypothetical protein HU762_21400 [Pseudomonas sp. SWRI92]|uniref:hypothetical protein n=1 Tax=Pseudomonas sp. SWRI92 TaxID=2745499 RepID=UPI0016486FA9|nr:hypothetical protein [Pseudomonas sp. SWRI92]MBC3376503.1 hypothetical protein [Pseudomonas sp. SWRI92]
MNAKVGTAATNKQISLQNTILFDPATFPEQTLPGGDLRIPVAALNADLVYEVPQPDQEFDKDTIDIFMQVKGDPTTRFDLESAKPLGDPPSARIWPLRLSIPLARLIELPAPETPTEYELVYEMFAGGVNPGGEVVAEYVIDRTKPYQTKTPPTDYAPPAAEFPANLPPTQEIDADYLTANPSGIVITVPLATSNAETTDTVNIYWGIPGTPAFDTPVLSDHPLPVSGEIPLDVTILEDSAEGVNFLKYVVRDLAGNISRESRLNQRTVRHLEPPVPTTPVVPLADGTDGDNLINLADCADGVTVEITVPQPSQGRDMIRVTWQDIELSPDQTVGTETLLSFPVDYETVIKPAYGATDGRKATTVSYVMVRGSGNPIATGQTTIDVDISYAGPENPEEPDPENPNLELPRLVSSQGVDNVLDDDDHGKPADIYIQLYDVPPTETGQVVTVWYDDVELDPYYLTPGEEDTEILAATVPWDVIARKPNEVIKIKWVLSAVGGSNPQSSLPQDVDVDITKIELPMPEVQGLSRNAIACPTLNFVNGDGTSRRNLKVVIPFSSSLVDGRTVTLNWGGYSDENATVPISGTATTATHLISGTVPTEGIEMVIGDYSDNFRPVSDGYGKLFYTVTDVTPESDPAIHFVFLTDNNGDFCEIANPVP